MLRLFDTFAPLFKSWRVDRYEQEGETYMLHISACLQDGSKLELRDYLFADGSRKYTYQWMEDDGSLRLRWDNAPHWPEIATAPHHVHMPDQRTPAASTITNLEDLLAFLAKSSLRESE